MRRHTRRVLTLLLALALCLGLLPMAVMAEEEEYDITFDANGGKFSDGTTTRVLRTVTSTEYGSDVKHHYVYHPDETPTREGYMFQCWYLVSPTEVPGITNIDFTKNETVKAYWAPAPVLTLDPNGGTCPVKTVELDSSGAIPTLREELPVPTREGYDFAGWYYETPNIPYHEVKVGDTFQADTTLTAEWVEKYESRVREVWFHLEGGTVVSVGGIAPDSGGTVKLPQGDFMQRPDDGEEILGVMLTDDSGRLAALPVLEREGDAFDGWYTAKTGGNKVNEGYTFTGSGKYGRDYLWAHWTEAGSGTSSAGTKEDGPFTVRFDLNCKDPRLSEVPKARTVQRGSAVPLPDGSKLTPPGSDYEFYAWCVLGSDGKLFPWNESHAVTGDMTLYAGWIRKEENSASAPSGSKPVDAKPVETAKPTETAKPAKPAKSAFTDVAETSPFAPAIAWAVEKGITNGKTPTSFGPEDPCTRAQIVTFLWRAAGSPEPKLTETEYVDVTDPGAYYYKAVQWAAEMDMEYSGTFSPGDTCTRATAVYFIWKASGSPKAGTKASFTDLPEEPEDGSQWYWPDLLDAVDWAVGQGVTNGTGDGTTFSPDNPCTRGQIVTFLYRAYEA